MESNMNHIDLHKPELNIEPLIYNELLDTTTISIRYNYYIKCIINR